MRWRKSEVCVRLSQSTLGLLAIEPHHHDLACVNRGARRERPFCERCVIVAEVHPAEVNTVRAVIHDFNPGSMLTEMIDWPGQILRLDLVDAEGWKGRDASHEGIDSSWSGQAGGGIGRQTRWSRGGRGERLGACRRNDRVEAHREGDIRTTTVDLVNFNRHDVLSLDQGGARNRERPFVGCISHTGILRSGAVSESVGHSKQVDSLPIEVESGPIIDQHLHGECSLCRG